MRVFLLCLVAVAAAQLDTTTLLHPETTPELRDVATTTTTTATASLCLADDGVTYTECLCPNGLFRVRNALPLLTVARPVVLPALAAVDVPHVRCN